MKSIKYFIRYIKETKQYRKESIMHLMIHNKLIRQAKWYAKTMKMTDKMIKHFNTSY